jgi:RimJ/RimL family protein N-acetyltransferase
MIVNRLIYGKSQDVAKWVADKIPHMHNGDFGKCEAIGITDRKEKEMIAGVVFSDYQPENKNIQLSIASINKMWASKKVIKDFLAYPFYQLDCYKVWTMCPLNATITLRVLESSGFKREAVLSHHFGKKHHAVICRLLKPEYQKLYEVK